MFQPPRIGLDALNKALLFLALLAGLLSLFFPYGAVPRLICTAVLGLCVALAVFRLFSGNRDRRYTENQRYLTFTTGLREWWMRVRNAGQRPAGQKRAKQPKPPKAEKIRQHRAHKARKNPTWSEIKHYKYLICPQCTQRLRVPRGKGRLRVTCTRCGNKFEAKS